MIWSNKHYNYYIKLFAARLQPFTDLWHLKNKKQSDVVFVTFPYVLFPFSDHLYTVWLLSQYQEQG